jgi:hypothetical protein
MSSYSQRREPITYIRGYAVDLTTLLLIVHVAATILAVFAFAAGYRDWCNAHLIFNTRTFLAGSFWTPLTDPFYHDISYDHIWLVLSFFLLWRYGKEIEAYLGPAQLGVLYASMILLPVLAAFPASMLLGGPMGIRVPYLPVAAHYGIFFAFCLMYPNVVFCTGLAAKWHVVIYTSLVTLALIGLPAPRLLVPFYACLAAALIVMQWQGANRWLDAGEWWDRVKTGRAEKKFLARQRTEVKEEIEYNEAVDPILEKISREGIQSLTADEKRRLERARARLLKKDGTR